MSGKFDIKGGSTSKLSETTELTSPEGCSAEPSQDKVENYLQPPKAKHLQSETEQNKTIKDSYKPDVKVPSYKCLLDATNSLENASKISRATSTDFEEDSKIKSSNCKYCKVRLSKLRLLEGIKARKSSKSHSVLSKSHFKRRMCTNKSCQTSAGFFEKAEMTDIEKRNLAVILPLMNGRHNHFCKCIRLGKGNCQCGETDEDLHWAWDPHTRAQETELSENNRLVMFHKDFSSGTAAIRGQQAMKNDQYFWEIKMTSDVYGTDMMIGVGTESVELNSFATTFCSMLGRDADSWGISYSGYIQHDGHKKDYCSRFGKGSLIGVHLDMWHGRVAFFKNRHPLGIAYNGLRGRSLYPMVCSTAARSGMKVISSRSFPSSLQFLCFQKLRQCVPDHLDVLEVLTMPPGLKQYLSHKLTWLGHSSSPQPNSLISPNGICRICLPLKGVFGGLTDSEASDTEDEQDLFLLVQSEDESESDEGEGEDTDSSAGSYLMKTICRKRELGEGTSSQLDTKEYPYGVKKFKCDDVETHILFQSKDVNIEASDDSEHSCDQASSAYDDSDTETKATVIDTIYRRLSRKRKR